MLNKIQNFSIIIFLIVGFILGLGFSVFAWTNPSQNPPNGGGLIQTSGGNLVIPSGNIGIGTTAPDYKLTVAGPIYTTQLGGFRIGISGASPEYGIRFDTVTTGGWARELSFSHSGSKVGSIGMYGSSSTPIYLYFNANQQGASTGYASPHMVITPSGNVGIGTIAPTSNLHVVANFGDSEISSNKVAFSVTSNFNPSSSISTFSGSAGSTLSVNVPSGVTLTSSDNHLSAFRGIVRKFGGGTVNSIIGIGGAWHWFNEGNVQNFYNLFAARLSQNGGTGTVENAYGVYIAGQKQPFVTNAYGVYQAGSSDINYFAGNVGIGTTNPTTGKLVISGGDLDMTGNRIINVSTPINGSDAATKAYVDAQAGGSVFPIRCAWSTINGSVGSCTPSACPSGYLSSNVGCVATGYGIDCSSGLTTYTGYGYYCNALNVYYGLMTGFCERWCYK